MQTVTLAPRVGSGPHAGAYRPPAIGRGGVVAAAHGLAATAGLRVLFGGGTAVDAAVAVGATLGVVEPFMSGIGGGGGAMLIYEEATRPVHALDYLGPAATSAGEWSTRLAQQAAGSMRPTWTATSPRGANHWRSTIAVGECTAHRRPLPVSSIWSVSTCSHQRSYARWSTIRPTTCICCWK